MTQPPLLHLAGPEVLAAMPSVSARLELARRALRALGTGAQLPPKIGVHPRPDASWAHAMPAWVPGDTDDGTGDLLGVKFVSGFPANGTQGLPALYATLLMCDPLTGRPRAVMDAGPITVARTAAISGVVVATWGPSSPAPIVALIGAGAQAEGHVEVLRSILPDSHLRIHDRDAQRARALAARAADTGSFLSATTSDSAATAISGAEVVLTMVSFGPDRQGVPAEAFREARLVIAVDYDMCLPSSVAQEADLFLVDEVGQFLANRDGGIFQGYPDPAGTIGERLARSGAGPTGRLVAVHLGTGVADLVLGDAVLRIAQANGLGTALPG
jgi:ornithine cyclodeaminase/alanine dehydrogenase-like protein (mu-crystallin family)